jgi:hypothetical protein
MTDFSTSFPLLWKNNVEQPQSKAARLPSENLIVRIAREHAPFFLNNAGET